MKDTSGAAFPMNWVKQEAPNLNLILEQRGMTLRDYAAIKAMQAFIDPKEWQSTVGQISSEVAFNAYAMADAMLEERKR